MVPSNLHRDEAKIYKKYIEISISDKWNQNLDLVVDSNMKVKGFNETIYLDNILQNPYESWQD